MNDNRVLTANALEQKRGRGISGTGLKLIALVSMLMDHISYIFGYTGRIPWWFGLAGRLAAPLFLFCLVEGFTHTRSRKKYFCRLLCIAAPMGLLLFLMRFAGIFVRPDGFYPQNAMLSAFLLLILCFQAFEWIGTGKPKKIAAGIAVLLGLFLWPFVLGLFSMTGVAGANIVGILGYTLLPVLNISGDVTLPVLLAGIALYLTRKNRRVQALSLIVTEFLWHFVLVFFVMRTQPGFEFSQMFTMYYEWMGAVFAAPLILWYNGKRGAGHGTFFYVFYPAHIYILYALSWLMMAAGS